jgi:hypothetical protein
MDSETIINNLHELITIITGTESLLRKTLPGLKDKYGTDEFDKYADIHGRFKYEKFHMLGQIHERY